MVKVIFSVLGFWAGWLLLGYFIGVPLSVAADIMLDGRKTSSKFGFALVWPLVLIIVIMVFPIWIRNWQDERMKRG